MRKRGGHGVRQSKDYQKHWIQVRSFVDRIKPAAGHGMKEECVVYITTQPPPGEAITEPYILVFTIFKTVVKYQLGEEVRLTLGDGSVLDSNSGGRHFDSGWFKREAWNVVE